MKKKLLLVLFIGLLFSGSPLVCMKRKRMDGDDGSPPKKRKWVPIAVARRKRELEAKKKKDLKEKKRRDLEKKKKEKRTSKKRKRSKKSSDKGGSKKKRRKKGNRCEKYKHANGDYLCRDCGYSHENVKTF